MDCGMCCDGTLFDGVRLELGDDGAKLKELGLPVKISRGRNPVARFAQPCVALCGDQGCRVYADRPSQCRTFECKLFKAVRAGEVSLDVATRLIAKTKRMAEKARRLLRKMGDSDETRSLEERFHRIDDRLRSPDAEGEILMLYADLSQVMHRFKLLAHERFYVEKDAAGNVVS